MRRIIPLGLFLIASAASAQKALPLLEPVKPLRPLGVASWGKDDYFKLKWEREIFGFIWAEYFPPRREIWIAENEHLLGEDYSIDVLSSRGEPEWNFKAGGRPSEFKLLDTGAKDPMIIARTSSALWGFEPGGVVREYKVERNFPVDFAVVGKPDGRPLIIAAYNYGDSGLRAFAPDGKLAWRSPEIANAGRVRLARYGGKPVLTAASGGNVSFVDLKGHVFERLACGGNLDRVMLDDDRGGQAWLHGFDSSADSWLETYSLRRGYAQKGKRAWELMSTQDLGPLTVTAYATGDFDGEGFRRAVVGTDNGWVFLLDREGKVVTKARFFGRIRRLVAADLDGDGKDELIVVRGSGYGSVMVFGRGAK